jgi:Divergent InlB B-repeat domain
MIGFNDSGWNIVPGNYERFITQLDPDNTSKALWRVGTATSGPTKGIISATAPPYDRFARRSDTASGKNTMYFDIQNNLLPTPGQAVQINVTYRNDTAGQFLIKYDAVGDTLKTLTVNKTGLGTGANIWATASFVVTDWFFGNRQPTNTAPSGSDLQLVNVGPGDTIYHGIELVKRGSVTVSTQGQGTVNARNDSWIYSPLLSGPLDQGMRLDLSATPAQGWEFDSWLNDLAGKTKPIVFVGENTQIAAKFKYNGIFTSEDNFDSGTWTGGSYWTGPWTLTGTATAGATVQLTGNAANFSQITRSLSTPIPNATLTFDWDLDRIATKQPGTVEVFDTVTNAWKQVWSYSVKGGDPDASAQLVTATINLSAYVVSGVRFTLNANGSTARFWLDNVKITGIIP